MRHSTPHSLILSTAVFVIVSSIADAFQRVAPLTKSNLESTLSSSNTYFCGRRSAALASSSSSSPHRCSSLEKIYESVGSRRQLRAFPHDLASDKTVSFGFTQSQRIGNARGAALLQRQRSENNRARKGRQAIVMFATDDDASEALDEGPGVADVASTVSAPDDEEDLAAQYTEKVAEVRRELAEAGDGSGGLQEKPLTTLGIVLGVLVLFLGLGRLPALFWLIGSASLSEDSFRKELFEVSFTCCHLHCVMSLSLMIAMDLHPCNYNITGVGALIKETTRRCL